MGILVRTKDPSLYETHSYSSILDLQAYVLTGKDFPNTDDVFEKRMTKAAFKKLTDIDNTIYDVC